MADIKEKLVSKDPKILKNTARMPKEVARRGMGEGMDRVRQQVQPANGNGESPEQYGADKIDNSVNEAASRAGQTAKAAGNQIKNKIKTRDSFKQSGEDANPDQAGMQGSKPLKKDSIPKQDSNAQAYKGGKQNAQRTAQSKHQLGNAQRTMQATAKATRHTGKSTIKSDNKGTIKITGKASIKTTKATVKSAGRTVKTAQRTAKTTVKAAKVTTQATIRAAKAAAKAAVQAAKITAKAIATTIKAIIAAIKGLIAAIAAGGWVAVVIILAVGIIAAILSSAFGLFYSNDADGEGKPMTEAIVQIDMEFKSSIDAKIAELSAQGVHDEVKVIYEGDIDGDSASVNNWNDVLGIYAVMLTTDKEAGMDVITVTPEKIERLKSIFNEMNTVSYRTETAETPVDGQPSETPSSSSVLKIYVKLSSMTYEEVADKYNFTEDQRDILEEMMSPMYYSLFASLMGVDVLDGVNLADIISGLPAGTMGTEVIEAAATKLGCPYIWGAKGPNKFDCSGLVCWAVNEVDSSLGSKLYTSAAGQAKWCNDNGYAVGRSELQPGDLVFWQNLGCSGCDRWQEVHHTGIYIGDGKVLEASSSKGRVLIRNLWESSNYPLFMFARPYSH